MGDLLKYFSFNETRGLSNINTLLADIHEVTTIFLKKRRLFYPITPRRPPIVLY